jgi:serine/threonine protein kinase
VNPWAYAQVLADCHEHGLVHGDVKVDNVVNSLDTSRVTLVDFGTASIADGAQINYMVVRDLVWGRVSKHPCIVTWSVGDGNFLPFCVSWQQIGGRESGEGRRGGGGVGGKQALQCRMLQLKWADHCQTMTQIT